YYKAVCETPWTRAALQGRIADLFFPSWNYSTRPQAIEAADTGTPSFRVDLKVVKIQIWDDLRLPFWWIRTTMAISSKRRSRACYFKIFLQSRWRCWLLMMARPTIP